MVTKLNILQRLVKPLLNERGLIDSGADEEFATKEDLEAIAKDPALQKIYNALKAGVTKKFTAFNTERKSLQDENEMYKKINNEWEEYRPVVEAFASNPDGFVLNPEGDENRGNRGNGNKGKRGRGSENDDYQAAIDSLDTKYGKAAQTILQRMDQEHRMFELFTQLEEIRRTHHETYPDIKFDSQRVLKTAVDGGYNDLSLAYDKVYRDDFIKKDVDVQVTKRVAEELAKSRVPGETGGATQPSHFTLPDKTPSNFNEATKQVLDDIKGGTLHPKV